MGWQVKRHHAERDEHKVFITLRVMPLVVGFCELRTGHTNPKRQRGNPGGASLTLRVGVHHAPS